jgi:hypothetical protein
MSCWVVPSLAAELWHMPLEILLRCMGEGQVLSKQENGFTFVDVAPGGPKLTRPMTPPHLRPPTFTMAKEEEGADESDPVPAPVPAARERDAEPAEPEEGFEDETASKELGDWRTARRKASRMRVPPPKR